MDERFAQCQPQFVVCVRSGRVEPAFVNPNDDMHYLKAQLRVLPPSSYAILRAYIPFARPLGDADSGAQTSKVRT